MMEFDEIVVKESPGLCRCCLSEGCYKDLGSEYTWMNETEVYADMLLECFDISITQHNEGPNGPNRLICEVCITRLRDACNFKKQVMDSEKKFIDMIGRGEFRPKMLIYQTQMKCEDPNAVVASVEDADIEYLDDDIDFGDDDLKDELSQPSVSELPVAVATLPVKGKRGRPRKNTPVKPDKRAKVAKLDDKAKTSKTVAKGNDDAVKQIPEATPDPQYVYIGTDDAAKKTREAERQRKDELTRFMTVLIENTSILPFRWSANKYMCFYCCCDFLDSTKLKEHTIEEHKGANLKNVLRSLVSSSRVKLDTSQMICKKCNQQFQVFDEILAHLATSHEFKFDEEIGKCMFTFNLSDESMSCNECGQDDFRFFATLLKHAHKFHNKNKTFLCEICGQGFVGRANVTSHIKNIHKNKELKCEKCDQVFKNYYTLQVHLDQVHKTESLKCPKCPEILTSQYMKKRHLATVHDVKKLQFSCDQCDLVYTMKSRLVQHQQRTHLKTKTVTCDICGFKVFNNDLLKRHMVRHDDNFRPYECKICERAFQRKKTLNIHLRIHMNDKRYACRECGKAFVQVTSWKLHMRVHHGVEGAVWN